MIRPTTRRPAAWGDAYGKGAGQSSSGVAYSGGGSGWGCSCKCTLLLLLLVACILVAGANVMAMERRRCAARLDQLEDVRRGWGWGVRDGVRSCVVLCDWARHEMEEDAVKSPRASRCWKESPRQGCSRCVCVCVC